MISFVSGTVAAIAPDGVVVDVGGVGLSLVCGPRTLVGLQVGAAARVPTALVVREESLTLFGFVDDEERAAFDALQSVTGIGPRTAQTVLSVLTVSELRAAVAEDDLAVLSRPPGIGRKSAARMALELKDRLGAPAPTVGSPASGAPDWATPVVDGLVALGWPAREARAATEAVSAEAQDVIAGGGEPSVPTLLRSALRHLDRA